MADASPAVLLNVGVPLDSSERAMSGALLLASKSCATEVVISDRDRVRLVCGGRRRRCWICVAGRWRGVSRWVPEESLHH